MAMITSAKHSKLPSDVPISNLGTTGLSSPSVVRFKLFTLDNRLVANTVGKLEGADWSAVQKTLGEILPTKEA